MIWAGIGEFVGRLVFSYLSEAIGRVPCGAMDGFGAAAALIVGGFMYDAFIGTASVFWLMIIVSRFFSGGGFAAIGPYAAEVWPAGLRASGMGAAYGFGSLGKIIGPLRLALIVGSSDVIKPEASVQRILPACLYLTRWHIISRI